MNKLRIFAEEKEFGKGITHIEDLKPAQLLALLQQFNLGKGFTVTEKMDGFFMTFGKDQSGFFAGTKNTTWRSAADFPDLYFLAGLKNYIQRLQTLDVGGSVQQAFNLPSPPLNVRITGESIPSYDHNIVMYDPSIIGDGVFVIYQMTFDGQQVTDPKEINKWIQIAQTSTTIKFFTNPQVAWKFKAPKKIVVDLEKVIAKHGNILSKPARTEEDKILKQAIISKVQQAGMLIKQRILKDPYNPFFGGDFEGFVVHMPDGSMVKVIDKDKFTKAKEENWHFIDNMQTAERDFKKNTKGSPENLAAHVQSFENAIVGIKDDFQANADKYISIARKKQDTIEELKLYARKIAKLKELVKQGQMEPQQIIDLYNKRQINEQSNRAIFQEGGHAFGDLVNSVVPKQFLDPTIKQALKSIGLDNAGYRIVGNVSKPYLGDIDVAINSKELASTYSLDTTDQDTFWASLDSTLEKYNVPYTVNKGFKQFHVVTNVVDQSGAVQPAVDETGKVKLPKQKAKVQIDFFVGSIDWMKDVLSGAPERSKYKAYFRNVLLRSIVSLVRNPRKPNERYVLDFKSGVDLVKFEVLPPTGRQKKEQENITSRAAYLGDANALAKWLFGPNHSWKDIESFEDLAALIRSPDFIFKSYLPQILEKFRKEVAKDKKEVPQETMAEQASSSSSSLPGNKTVGLFLGGFKPFHRGHMAAVEMASKQCDVVKVIASQKDRDKGGFALSGNVAMEFWNRFVLPIMPDNVQVIFSDKPYNEMVRILHEEVEPSGDNVVIYGDKDDLLANFGGETYRKLQRYIPNTIASHKISLEQVPRITSGTKVREAIMTGNLKAIRDNMPEQLKNQAPEILQFFREKMGNNKEAV